jgi:hypothetical protein
LAFSIFSERRDGDQGPFLFETALQTLSMLENDGDYMFLARM